MTMNEVGGNRPEESQMNMTQDREIAPIVELSDAELDAVAGGQVIVGGLIAVLAQVAANVAALNVTGGNFSQTTGGQTITITG